MHTSYIQKNQKHFANCFQNLVNARASLLLLFTGVGSGGGGGGGVGKGDMCPPTFFYWGALLTPHFSFST